MSVADFPAAFNKLRPTIERDYPLTLHDAVYDPARYDDGYAVDYRIFADLNGPMSLLDLVGLEQWIHERTGAFVAIDTVRKGNRTIDQGATAAE
jgi:hypothetical protein